MAMVRTTPAVWPYRTAAAFLIVAAAVLRVVYLGWFSALELAPDEAHYWDWSRRLDWSYYSKGPLVALLIRGSCELFGQLSLQWTGSEALAVRLPAVVCGMLLLTALYVLTTRVWNSERWALATVAMAMTFPMVAAGASLITIDAPFTCLWAWALVTGHDALFRGKPTAWAMTGCLVALGILAKPTMVLFGPCLALFVLATPGYRPLFFKREFWLFAGIAALGTVPILYWNSQHGWVTFLHTGSHAGVHAKRLIYWHGPLLYLGMQMGLLLVYWFLAWAGAMWKYRPWTGVRPQEAFLWWMSTPIVVFFGLAAFKNGGGEPNWPIAAYIAGLVLAIGFIDEQLHSASAFRRRMNLAGLGVVAALGVVASLLVHFPIVCQPVFATLAGPATETRMMPIRRVDPTVRMRGWATLAAAVDAARTDLRSRGVEPILAGMNWGLPGTLAFHLPDHPTVYSLGIAQRDRSSQYDIWRPNPLADPDDFRGQTFVIVNGEAPVLRELFDAVESSTRIDYREGDQLISMWSISICHGYRGASLSAGKRY